MFSFFPPFIVVWLFRSVWLFVSPWNAACQDSLSFTISQRFLKLMSTELMMPSNHLILITPFSSCLKSFPASESFLMTLIFASSGLSIRALASASALAMNIQGWFPLGLTGWISLQSRGLSRVFPNTTVQKIQFFSAPFLYSPTLTSIQDYWKNHCFD